MRNKPLAALVAVGLLGLAACSQKTGDAADTTLNSAANDTEANFNEMGSTLDNAGDSAAPALNNAGDALANGATAAGNAIDNAASSTGKALSNAGNTITNSAR
jgi:hypothetical protein